MTKYQSVQQSQWANFQIEHEALAAGSGQTAVTTKLMGGVYRSSLPTYDDGDAALLHFTSDGKLMVDTELTLDGSIIINNLGGAAAHDAAIAGNPLQMGVYAANFDGAALPGAVDAEGDVTYLKASLSGVQYVMPVNEDGSKTTIYAEDSAHANADGGTFILAVRNDAGTSLVDTDGDYAPLQVDSDGALAVSITNSTYAEDAGHTSGDEGIFLLGIRTDTIGTAANIAGTDADYMGLQMNAKGALYTDLSSVLGADMSASNGAFFNLTDNTTVAGITAGLTALKVDLVGEGGATIAATNPVFVELTDGTTAVSASNPLNVQLGDGTDQVNIQNATALVIDDVATNDGLQTASLLYGYDNTGAAETWRAIAINSAGNLEIDSVNLGGQAINLGAGGVDTGTQRITLASDDPAVVSLAVMDDWDNAAFAETESESSNSAFTTSVIYGFDSEAGAGSQLRAAQVAVDNIGLSATPNVLVGGGIYKTAFDTYDDNDAVPFHFDVSGRLHTKVSQENKPVVTNATGALALATSTTISNNFRLVGVTVHFSAAPSTAENFTITLNANDGAAYDTVLFSIDPSATSATDIVYIPDKELMFESGDEIDVAFTNTDTVTYGLRIVTQVI